MSTVGHPSNGFEPSSTKILVVLAPLGALRALFRCIVGLVGTRVTVEDRAKSREKVTEFAVALSIQSS